MDLKLSERIRWLLRPANSISAALLLAAVIALIVVQQATELDIFTASGMKEVVNRSHPWGPVLYVLILALTVVVSQLPGIPLAIAAGMVWGAGLGTALSVAGGFAGGLMSYMIGRTVGRSVILALTGRVVMFSERHGQRFLAIAVFLTRLIPVLSFDIVSYAAGLSKQRADYYSVATVIGMTPPTFLICSAGAQLSVGPTFGLGASIAAAALVIILPIAVRRWNLFGLGDMVRMVKVETDQAPSS